MAGGCAIAFDGAGTGGVASTMAGFAGAGGCGRLLAVDGDAVLDRVAAGVKVFELAWGIFELAWGMLKPRSAARSAGARLAAQ